MATQEPRKMRVSLDAWFMLNSDISDKNLLLSRLKSNFFVISDFFF